MILLIYFQHLYTAVKTSIITAVKGTKKKGKTHLIKSYKTKQITTFSLQSVANYSCNCWCVF